MYREFDSLRYVMGRLDPRLVWPAFTLLVLIAGLLLFFALHLVPAAPPLRSALVGRLGAARYKGIFSLLSFAALAVIVAGYAYSGPRDPLFAPPPWARAYAHPAVTLAFILFAAANMRGYLRRTLKHPMLIGVLLWSSAHFLVNGDRAGSILFGAFFAYAVVDLVSALTRSPGTPFEPQVKFDLMAVGGGIAVTLLVMLFHRLLFGVRIASFGL